MDYQKLTILQVVADGSPGGGTVVVLALVAHLLEAGHDVHVITQPTSHLAACATSLGARVHPVDLFSRRNPLRRNLSNVVRSIRPSLIHTHGSRALFSMSASSRRVPTIHTVHGYHILHRRGVSKVVGKVAEIFAVRNVRHVIFVSDEDARLGAQHGLVPKTVPVSVVHNGVDHRALVPASKSFAGPVVKIGWVSRLVPQKDPLLAVEIARILDGKCKLIMMGGGELEVEVRKKISEFSLDGAVTLLGSLPHETVMTTLKACDVMLLTSQWEGLPIAPLEAMALGVPVVAPALPSLREIIRENEGVLVSDRSPASFVHAIRSLDEPSHRKAVAAAARTRVETSFTWEACVQRYDEIYLTVT